MSFATGKRIVVTGANSGIGFETARLLSSFGAEVIMVCRNRNRGEAARQAILHRDPDADLTLFIADLSSKRSTADLITEIRRNYTSLHVLVNNAGALLHERKTTEDGLEYTFALNHMGPFRLTLGLMDLLQAGAPSRVITISSEGHRFSKISTPAEIEQLINPLDYRGFTSYCNSKLANILFTRELARRYGKNGISAVSLHPGFVRTDFGNLKNSPFSAKLFSLMMRLCAVSPEHGAATPVHLADSESITNGMYYAKKKLKKPSAAARSDNLAAALWGISTE